MATAMLLTYGYALSLPLSMAGMELFSSLLILTALVTLVRQKSFRSAWDLKTTKAALALWAWIAISALLAPDLVLEDRLKIIGEGRWVLVLLALIVVFQDRKLASVSLKIALGVSAVVAIYSVVQSFTGFDFKSRIFSDSAITAGQMVLYRARGFFSNSMTYGQALQFLFYGAIGVWLVSPQKWRSTQVVLIGLGLVLSFTRSVWLAAALSTLIASALVSRRAFIGILATLALIAGSGYSLSPTVRARVDAAFNPQDAGAQDRWALWQANWRMFKAHPITGVGLGKGSDRVAEHFNPATGPLKFVSHAHNIFLEYLATTGLPGLLFFLSFLAAIFMDWRRHRRLFTDPSERAYSCALLAALIGLGLSGLTEANFNDGEVNHAFLFVVGLTLAPLALKPKAHGVI